MPVACWALRPEPLEECAGRSWHVGVSLGASALVLLLPMSDECWQQTGVSLENLENLLFLLI